MRSIAPSKVVGVSILICFFGAVFGVAVDDIGFVPAISTFASAIAVAMVLMFAIYLIAK